VDFGQKKCPLCGDRGMELEEGTFVCNKCEVTFNNFSILTFGKKECDKIFCN
jgi:uncharacterized membrane protein